jgi:hypothetical protein
LAPKLEIGSDVFHPIVSVEESSESILQVVNRPEVFFTLNVLKVELCPDVTIADCVVVVDVVN